MTPSSMLLTESSLVCTSRLPRRFRLLWTFGHTWRVLAIGVMARPPLLAGLRRWPMLVTGSSGLRRTQSQPLPDTEPIHKAPLLKLSVSRGTLLFKSSRNKCSATRTNQDTGQARSPEPCPNFPGKQCGTQGTYCQCIQHMNTRNR